MLYAVTGIVLANMLTTEEFGLVGAVLVFQAFATLLVDSGFSYALIQRKHPSRLDYSTVLWFNVGLSVILYLVLYACAPLIADCYHGDQRIIPLARVIFLSMVLNATAIVQTNRLMKAMDVRMVAVSNSIGLIIGGATGIVLAVTGFGAWAIAWQTIVTAAVKSLILWTTSHWLPMLRFSWSSLRSYFGMGSRMMVTAFLSVIFQQIYSFLIGNRVGMSSLGYYTQADKWSKMGYTSITQTLTSSFLPGLSAVQDEPERFAAMVSKMNRFTSYVVFPFMLGLMVMGRQIFHMLFGDKWDPSILLFQLLLLRGIFMVFNTLYTNYMLALGHGGTIVKLEVVRDVAAILGLVVTLPFMAMTTPDDPVLGITIMLWGQLAATIITWVANLVYAVKLTRVGFWRYIADMLPYFAQTAVIIPIMVLCAEITDAAWLKVLIEAAVGLGLYIGGNRLFGSKIQKDIVLYFRHGKIM